MNWKLSLLTFAGAIGAFGGVTFTTIDYPGAASTQTWSINTRGDIVGNYVSVDKLNHGFLLSGGKYTSIDYPGATGTSVYGINPSGDILGEYTFADAINHGYLLQAGQFTNIDYPGADNTYIGAINSRGEVVGYYTLPDKTQHGFLLSAGKYTTIDFPGATVNLLTGINAQGDISGSFDGHAFLLSDGEFIAYDAPGATFTNTTGINARGDIVGRYVAGGVSRGYLLISGQISTIEYPGATFTRATSINQRGDILGSFRKADGIFHGFLLTGFQPSCIMFAPRVFTTSDGVAVTHSSDFTLVSASKPAVAGEVLSLFATGLGPTRPTVDSGMPFPSSPLAAVTSAVEVRVNGKVASILGSVGFPGSVDGYQVNFRVPADISKGIASVQLSAGPMLAAPVTIAIQ